MPLDSRSPDTVTIEELAQILGISRTHAYLLAQRDELPVPTIRLGRRIVISRRALERLLDGPRTDQRERSSAWR